MWNEQVSWLRKGGDRTTSQYCNQLQKGLRFSTFLSLKWYYQTLHESFPLPTHPSCKDSKDVILILYNDNYEWGDWKNLLHS